MAINIPIQDSTSSDVPVGVVFAGNTALVVSGGVAYTGQVNFLGNTQMLVGLGLSVTGAVHFDGNSAMTVRGRMDNEPDTFDAVNFIGSTELLIGVPDVPVIRVVTATVLFAGNTALVISGAELAQPIPDLVLSIFVDIEDSAIAAAQNLNLRRYRARLLVDGVEIPMRKAALNAAPESLGLQLQVTLVTPDYNLIGLTSTVVFQLGIFAQSDQAFHYVTLLSGGKLSARSKAVRNESGRPVDEVNFTIIDVVADRWNRAPRIPLHLYDPYEIDAPDPTALAAGRIGVDGGGYIDPINIPVTGLTLATALAQAYITGTGFSQIVSNIPNFPITEVTFTLDGGYDAGVRPLLSLFGPLLFGDDNNRLFIVDPDAPLPAGFTPRLFPVSQIVDLTDSMPQREQINAMVVTVKDLSLGGDFFTERLDQDVSNTGQFGDVGFTETTVEKRVREYRTLVAPLVVIREETVSEISTTRANVERAGSTPGSIISVFDIIEHSSLIQHFDSLNRKTGYSRRTDRLLPDPQNGGAMTLMTDASVQEQNITYRANPLNPSEDVQDTCTTVESGYVLSDQDNQYLDKPYKIPLNNAHQSGYVDSSDGGNQTLEHRTIKTTIESLRVRGQQISTETRVIDHVSQLTTQNSITERPGAVTLNRKIQAPSRTILITTPGTSTVGRRAGSFNAGDLPFGIGMSLARRKLKRLNDPPREISISPAYVDLSIRRGKVLRVQTRTGTTLGDYIVMGYSITVSEYKPITGSQVSMQITARQLLP